jgi:hypothetical protein
VILAVGGNARGVGKTTLICAIIREFPGVHWQALKVTPHEHLHASGDTERFLAAGARAAYQRVPAHLPSLDTGNWVIESNRILDVLTPDAYIFIQATAPPDEKPRERWHLERAALVLKDWPPSEQLPIAVRELISSLSR